MFSKKTFLHISVIVACILFSFLILNRSIIKKKLTSMIFEVTCVCNLSENVIPSIKLYVEVDKPWSSYSYHLIKWKKSCNISSVNLKIKDLENNIIDNYKFNSCDSEFVYKVPVIKQKEFYIEINGSLNDSVFITSDSKSVKYIMGENKEYEWKLLNENAEFYERDGVVGAHIKDKLFLFGGWNPNKQYHTNNEIWVSDAGKHWNFKGYAPWSRRHTSGYASFKNKFWIIGGDCNQGFYNNDIWSTTDGIRWIKEIDSIPWEPRMNFGVRVFDNKLWLFGGEKVNYSIAEEKRMFNDVWCSEDGVNWEQVSKSSDWSPRAYQSSLFKNQDRLIVMGGGQYGEINNAYNDIWTSLNGSEWEMVLKSAPWKGKRYPDFTFFDDKIWIIGGVKESENTNKVWYSKDLYNWYQLDNVPWQPRHATALISYDDKLIMAAGFLKNDVWELSVKK